MTRPLPTADARLTTVVLALSLLVSACASAPATPAAKPAAPAVDQRAFEQKMAWILRLEDQRILRDPAPVPAPPPPPAVPARGQKPAPVVAPPPPPPG
jgi:hypothetical protein